MSMKRPTLTKASLEAVTAGIELARQLSQR